MNRKKFIRTCGFAVVGLPLSFGLLQACGGIYYAVTTETDDKITVGKDQFIVSSKKSEKTRDFVLWNHNDLKFPSVCTKQQTIDISLPCLNVLTKAANSMLMVASTAALVTAVNLPPMGVF